jgi:hypothetical protein
MQFVCEGVQLEIPGMDSTGAVLDQALRSIGDVLKDRFKQNATNLIIGGIRSAGNSFFNLF